MARLGDICTVVSGSTPKTGIPEYWDGEIKWITPAELSEDSYYLYDSVRHITEEGRVKTGLSFMPKGTVILSSRAPIGKTAILGCEMCCNQGFKNLICSDVIYNEYLYHFLKCNTEYLNSLGRGATFKEISKSIVEDIDIPLPDYEEQISIAHRIHKIDTLISLRQQQLSKLDELVKSRFIELFGDVSDFVNITDIAHTYIGLVTTMTKHYCNNGTPLLFNSSIKSDKIVWDGTYLDMEFAEANKSRMHKTNDIVTVHTGDIGTSAVVGEEFNNSLGFATIVTRINDISRYYPRFVSSFLNYGSGKEQLKKYSRDVRNNLNLKDFNRLMVPNVSVLEQKRYVDFLEQTDKSKSEIQKSLEKLETLKKALMQKYFG